MKIKYVVIFVILAGGCDSFIASSFHYIDLAWDRFTENRVGGCVGGLIPREYIYYNTNNFVLIHSTKMCRRGLLSREK